MTCSPSGCPDNGDQLEGLTLMSRYFDDDDPPSSYIGKKDIFMS